MKNVYPPENTAGKRDEDDELLNDAFTHYRALNYFGLLFTRDITATTDLVKDTYTDWWKNHHQHQAPVAIREFLFTHMIDLSFDWMIRTRTPIRLPVNPAEKPPAIRDIGISDAHLKAVYVFTGIQLYLLNLPPVDNQVLTLFLLDDKTTTDIAEHLVLPLSAVTDLITTEIPPLKQYIITGAKAIGS
ncbi:sigma-70 family RNA polymerase sigma factor [Pseudoflavitalea sp. X16]|uniref:RNA polymerase sigma factor n=1 Tax=Paraflavitalea devenefica TaxID=2716334 RepID=UPI00141E4B24|nr:sigma-70 family RNA polymerase sigma factor [Paraflavitalea devenefica]NII26197.1 sigma-70 family RNA polymerase sigma factor [Paraflavitalea devenefica]